MPRPSYLPADSLRDLLAKCPQHTFLDVLRCMAPVSTADLHAELKELTAGELALYLAWQQGEHRVIYDGLRWTVVVAIENMEAASEEGV